MSECARFYYGTNYASYITLYAESITVSTTGYNKQIPIRDKALPRTKYPVFINLGYSGSKITLDGYVDITEYTKMLTLLPDMVLKTDGVSLYPQLGTATKYWEINAIETSAIQGTSNYHKYKLTITEQHDPPET